MKNFLSFCLLSLGLLASTIHADTKALYVGFGLADGSAEVSGGNDKSLGTLAATVGLQLGDFVAVEVQAGAASDESSSILSEPLVSYQAALIRLGYRWDRIGVYALGGYAALSVDADLNDSEDGAALGFGINLFGNETTSLNLQVMEFDDGAFRTTTIGFQHYFGGFR